jgi:hypothetical protein
VLPSIRRLEILIDALQLARKITTYAQKAKSKGEQKGLRQQTPCVPWLNSKAGILDHTELGTPPLYAVQEFIIALAAATDGMSTCRT